MANNKKDNKSLLNEELNRFNKLTSYDYFGEATPVSENFSFYDVREDMEVNRPDMEDDDELILGVSEADEDEVNDSNPEATEDGEDDLEADIEDVEGDLGLDPQEAPEGGEEDLGLDGEEGFGDEMPAEDEIELDVTELVQGTEAAKQSADAANEKIGQLMNMVGKLENQLQSMSAISNKIDDLENELEKRAPTPEEKMEMRSLDSYPYNLKLTDYWSEKEGQYDIMNGEESEPKEYVLTKDDVESDYNERGIKDSFSDDYTEEDV
jgi:hypothetical protein